MVCTNDCACRVVCPFMIYGEVVQKWRLAKGATLRKWPHASGQALDLSCAIICHVLLQLTCALPGPSDTESIDACPYTM